MRASRLLLVAAVLTASALPAVAAPWRLEVGPVAGAVGLDPELADYRWDIRPRLEGGLEAAVNRGRWRFGLRLLRSETAQGTGLGDAVPDPTVRMTRGEMRVRYAAARVLGFELGVGVQAGRLHLGYAPDGLAVSPGAGLAPITVEYAPIDENVAGGSLELRRPLGRAWSAALSAEAATFALDTTHRRGDDLVRQRQRFWNIGVRLALAWGLDL